MDELKQCAPGLGVRLAHDSELKTLGSEGSHGWVRISHENRLIAASTNFQHSAEFLNKTRNAKRIAKEVADWLQEEWQDKKDDSCQNSDSGGLTDRKGERSRKTPIFKQLAPLLESSFPAGSSAGISAGENSPLGKRIRALTMSDSRMVSSSVTPERKSYTKNSRSKASAPYLSRPSTQRTEE